MSRLRLLFVCRGNNCRSPMAEAVMQYLSRECGLDWTCDSAGLRNWNVGRRPDKRCLEVLDENGMTTSHYGRMISLDDFMLFDYILAVDDTSLRELKDLAQHLLRNGYRAKVVSLASYLKNSEYDFNVIKDPFFSTNLNGFRCTFNQIFRSCQNFIDDHQHDSTDKNEPLIQNF